MGYRDETLALRERLVDLEPKFAKLSGQVRGLRLRKALLEDEGAELQIMLTKKLRRDRRKFFAGLLVIFSLAALAILGLGYAFYQRVVVNKGFVATVKVEPKDGETWETTGKVQITKLFFLDCDAQLSWERSEPTTVEGECDAEHGFSFWGSSQGQSFVMSTQVLKGAVGILRGREHRVIFTELRSSQ